MKNFSSPPSPSTDKVCPVTGLPVTSKPEWTDRRFGSDYRLTTRVIGDRILLNRPAGYAELTDIVESLRMTEAVAREHLNPSGGYVHISDYSGMRGITREARKYYIRHMARREKMLALIYFGVSPLFGTMIKLAKRLNIVTFNVLIVKDHKAAMAAAARLLRIAPAIPVANETGIRTKSDAITEHVEHGRRILRCDAWRLEMDDYALTVEVIDRCIYHACSSGTLREAHIEPVAQLREKIRRTLNLEKGFAAILTGTSNAHGTDHKARRMYVADLKRWHRQYPMVLYAFYNANRFIRTAAMLASPFMPFRVKVARDLAGALNLADRLIASPGFTGEEKPPLGAAAIDEPDSMVDQLLRYIGDIDWERHGAPTPRDVDKDNPFRPVFDAIALIKGELDTLLAEREKAERKLRASQQRFEEVLQQSRDILFKRDLKTGRYEYISEAAGRLLGIPPQSIRRMGFDGVKSLVHPDDLSRFLAYSQDLINATEDGRADQVVEYRMRDDRGAYRWFSASHAVIRDRHGRPVSIIGSNRDITARKAAERELEEMEAERLAVAERLQHTRKLEAVKTLAGGVAHNFNNLLMVVLGNLELMQMKAAKGRPSDREIEAAEHAALRAADLSTLMLTYVGQAQISPQDVDLNVTTAELVDVLKTTTAESARLTFTPAENPAWIHADASKVCQVITNLVANAVEAVGDSPPEIHLRVGNRHCDADLLDRLMPGEGLPAGRYVWLQVADNGRGMDPETLVKVFDPFFTTKFTGRGLGLAAVMGIMRTHRGGIHIHSQADAGTRVTVYFPAAEAVPSTVNSPPATPGQRHGTVLLVDDEPQVLELGQEMLARMGFEVLTAEDGVDALAQYDRHRDRICMAIVDITMPRMDGYETARRLLSSDAGLKVLIASGFTESQVREKMGALPVAGFIKKPFLFGQLQERIEAIFPAVRPRPA